MISNRDANVKLQDLLPYNYTALGSKASYTFGQRKLILTMLGNPTITLGNLIVNRNKLKSRGETTIYPQNGETSVEVQGPKNVKMPSVEIAGPTLVGKILLNKFLS